MLTLEQIAEIETKASSYGCGAYNCTACSPLQYGCDDCEGYESFFVFPMPILNGQEIECEQCCWINNEDEQHTEEQLRMFAKYNQTTRG
jgi:hypothetical protein